MSYDDIKIIDITLPGGKVIQYPLFINYFSIEPLVIRLRPVGSKKDVEEI